MVPNTYGTYLPSKSNGHKRTYVRHSTTRTGASGPKMGFCSDSRFRNFALMVREENDMEGAFADKAKVELACARVGWPGGLLTKQIEFAALTTPAGNLPRQSPTDRCTKKNSNSPKWS